MTNKHHTTLYVGVTSDLPRRIFEHVNHVFKDSFTDTYNLEKLVYYEVVESMEGAIIREKQIKKWRREKKEALINSMNVEWRDLGVEFYSK